jgi:hypothetical protein
VTGDGRRFEFEFKPTAAPPVIKHFCKEKTVKWIFNWFLGILLAFMPATLASVAQELSRCQNAIILDGIDFHGSLVCNPDWLDRRGSLAILAEAQSCKKTAGSKTLIMRGFADFDNSVKELGKIAACQKLDEVIKSMEKQ